MTGWVILGLAVAVLVVLAAGGALVARRRMAASSAGFLEHLRRANVDLATAHAADRGWDPEMLERAARAALQAGHPDLDVVELTLVEVVDRPGIEEDVAHYRAQASDGRDVLVTMARREGTWVADRIGR